MEALRLALRGLRWRAGSSAAVLVVSVVAMAGAALGPLYASSASESLVRDALASAPPVTTGVLSRGNIAGQTQFRPNQLAQAVQARAADPRLDPWYGPPTLSLTVLQGSPSIDGRALGVAEVSWYRGQCGGVTIVSGRCPDGPGQAMVSARLLKDSHARLGTTMRLGITSDPRADTVTLVGTYDPTTADPAVWGLAHPDQYSTPSNPDAPDILDEVLVDQATMERSNGDVAAVAFRALNAESVHLGDVPALRATVATVTDVTIAPPPIVGAPQISGGPPATLSISGLPDFLDSLQPVLDNVAATSFAVTAQLVLLAWFVLFLVIAATSEERSGEIALAKLRGMTPRSTVAFGLAEPVILLLVALPVGAALAYAADVWLTRRYLVPGTDVSMTPLVGLALLVCLLGGAVAAGLAVRGILTAPVLEQLRRTSGRRARLVRSSAVDAAAVALAAAGIYELNRGGSDSLALLAPGLMALAVGLLAVRALPWLARIEVARTRRSPRLASYLSSRNIARRPSGLRIVVLLSLAVGLAVFAVDGWVVSADNRADLARAQVGAARVLHVHAGSAGQLLAAVEQADPSGTHAMAATQSDNGSGGLLTVDASRLAAVTSWDPAWVHMTPADLAAALHPPQQTDPLPVRGSLTLAATYQGQGEPVLLSVVVRSATGLPSSVTMGVLRPGSHSYTVPLPTCVAAACSLSAFTFTHPIELPATNTVGTVVLGDARDAQGPVDLTAPGQTGWRSGASGLVNRIDSGAVVTSLDGGALHVKIRVEPIADGAIEVADHPLSLPVLQGSNAVKASGAPEGYDVIAGLDGRFTDVQILQTGVLPRLLRSGTMADLPFALAATGTVTDPLDYQVWLAPDAPASIVTDLQASGLSVVREESLDSTQAELDRGGTALALRLFLLAALVALVLGAGTLLANAYVVIRRRAYELAALRAIGAPRSVLVRAARREQVALALTGVALGAGAGLVAAGIALPPLVDSAGADGPPLRYGPAWLPVLAVVAVILVVLAVVADVGARRTVRRAMPDLLRQVQE